jgi:hypothetical protein
VGPFAPDRRLYRDGEPPVTPTCALRWLEPDWDDSAADSGSDRMRQGYIGSNWPEYW